MAQPFCLERSSLFLGAVESLHGIVAPAQATRGNEGLVLHEPTQVDQVPIRRHFWGAMIFHLPRYTPVI